MSRALPLVTAAASDAGLTDQGQEIVKLRSVVGMKSHRTHDMLTLLVVPPVLAVCFLFYWLTERTCCILLAKASLFGG
jgi:hypothetical protein